MYHVFDLKPMVRVRTLFIFSEDYLNNYYFIVSIHLYDKLHIVYHVRHVYLR